MGKRLLPTTKVQVSGHRFMRRRVEHGLIFGDVRMIHDPLASRRRAAAFGTVTVLLASGVMGLFAWMRPNPDPGDAAILRAADGELYVRVDDTVHPVTNLTSARLVAGTDAEPERIGDEALAALSRGVPVGIVAAPSLFAPGGDAATLIPPDKDTWSVCAADKKVVVRAGEAPAPLGEDEAVLAEVDGREWVITAEGRALLPSTDSEAGRIIRRALRISTRTPRWEPAPQVLTTITELPPYALPSPLPGVLRADDSMWVLSETGGIQEITQLQGRLLIDAGVSAVDIDRADLAAYADASPEVELKLPRVAPTWIDPKETAVCATDTGGGAVWSLEEAQAGAVELGGESAATHFAGLADGAVGVDTGRGFHVVGVTGLRHAVDDADALATIGAHRVAEVPWALIRLLPEGAELTREAAMRALY